jgi:predicted  nucleic acid-binding Zn-ribbon protein
MEPVGEYVQQIDRLLSAGAAMFPDHQPTAAVEKTANSAPVSAPDDQSGLAAAAQQAGARYQSVDGQIAELTESIDEAVKFAAAQAIQAGIQARTIRDTAHSQAEAIDAAATSSDGVGQLVSTLDERLAAMADHIASTREQLRATAAQIRHLSVELSAASAARR